jgi:hypothetical protein
MSKLALSITNSEINASAAIAGTKISPNFGSQNTTTTGIAAVGELQVTSTAPKITFFDSDTNPDFEIRNLNGVLHFKDVSSTAVRMQINTDGHVDILGNLDVGAGIDVTGAITGTAGLSIEGATVFNDAGADVDFRVEGDTDANLINVDAGNDLVNIGSTTNFAKFGVFKTVASDAVINSANAHIGIGSGSGSGTICQSILYFAPLNGSGNRSPAAITAIAGGNTSSDLAFFVNGNNNFGQTPNTQAMRITSDGKVGIGTTSPSRKLHVDSSFIRVDDGYGLDTSGATERVTLDNGFISLTTNSTERIRIDSGGRLLHGVTSSIDVCSVAPSRLQVHNNASVLTASFTGYGAHSGGSIIALGKSRSSTVGDATGAVSNGDTLGDIRFGGSDGTDMETTACAIRGEVDGSVSSNTMPGRLVFRTNSGSSSAERMRIDSSGNVGIGTTSPSNELVINKSGSAANCKLEISQSGGGGGTSEILFSDAVSGRGRIFYDHGSNPEGLKFEAAGTQTLIVTTAGKVGIGRTDPPNKLRVEDDASGVIVAKQTTNNGGFNTFEGRDSSGNIKFYASHNGRVGASEGIIFGTDTATDNVLDDYEEGNYVPTFGDDNGHNHTINTSYNNLAYEKIGSFVSVHGRIRLSAKNNSASGTYARLTLPFTSADLTEDAGRVSGSVVIQNSSVNVQDFGIHPTHEGNSYIQIGLSNVSTFSGDVHTKFSGNELVAVQIMYRAA